MAAPTTRSSTAPTSGLSVSSASSTAIGDLVLIGTWERAGAGVPTHTLQSGFTEIRTQGHDDGSTDGRLSLAYKVATSSGTQSYQAYTTSGSSAACWTACIVVTVGTFDVSSLPTSNGVSNTTTAAPNPPSVTGLTGDFLVLAYSAWHLSSAATVNVTPPTNYATVFVIDTSQTSQFASASRSLTGLSSATEDPGNYSDNTGLVTGTASITVAIKGASEILGSASITLGTLTDTGTGTVDNNAASNTTLGSLTTSSTGTVDNNAAVSITLGTLTDTGTGTVDNNAAASITLGALTDTATGTVGNEEISGSASITLGTLTDTGTGTVDNNASSNSTLGSLTTSSTGTVNNNAASSITLGNLACIATGQAPLPEITGQFTKSLGSLTCAGTGVKGFGPSPVNCTMNKPLAPLSATGRAESNWLTTFLNGNLSQAVTVQEDGSTIKPLSP